MRNVAGTVAAVCLLSQAAQGAEVIFSDVNFPNSNWGFEVFGPGTASATQNATGGNPGSARRVTMTSGALSPTHAISRFGTSNATRYEPATQGAIQSIFLTMQFSMVNGAGDAPRLAMAIKQNSFVFVSFQNQQMGNFGSWSVFATNELTASSFFCVNGSATLDFSATGAPLRVGFAVEIPATGSQVNTSVTDFDNFFVTITQVPTPGTAALLGVGLMAGRRRR